MSINKTIAGILGFLIMAGCTPFKKDPPVKQFFDLRIEQVRTDEQIHAMSATAGQTLLVKELAISPTFDSHAFVYRTDTNTYQTDFYNEFITYPARLVTDRISEQLYATKFFSQPRTHLKKDIDFRLSGKITHLYGDFQHPQSPKAVVGARLSLEKKKNSEFSSAVSHSYRFEVPISSRQPGDLVAGWSIGLNKIVIAFLTDLAE
jgi:cholesterol transport system auxiliary component